MDVKHKIQFGSDPDGLAEKVAAGGKTATSSLYDFYRMNIKEMTKVGEYASVTGADGTEKCIVRIERTEVMRFGDITESFAIEEGDGSLENWLEIHTEYYSSLLERMGRKLTDETELLCEWFKVVM